MLAITSHFFLLGELPLHFMQRAVNRGIRIRVVVMGNQHMIMLDMNASLGTHDVLDHFEHDLDRLNAIKVTGQLAGFLLGMLFESRGVSIWRVEKVITCSVLLSCMCLGAKTIVRENARGALTHKRGRTRFFSTGFEG